jgi:hypothetical protein
MSVRPCSRESMSDRVPSCIQQLLFRARCRCCAREAEIGVLCRPCSARGYRSQRFFGGHREAVLGRDQRCCRACGSREAIVVHHRRPGLQDPAWLITLCAACHAQVHRSQALRVWVPDGLAELWQEMHPNAPLQMRIEIARTIRTDSNRA